MVDSFCGQMNNTFYKSKILKNKKEKENYLCVSILMQKIKIKTLIQTYQIITSVLKQKKIIIKKHIKRISLIYMNI